MAERLRTRIEEVTDRQLEIARLVADGRTNPEIADALGITLDGAKYHVSELLGRLGLERREEIAGWYRQEARPRRTRWLSALVGSPLAAGATAAAVVGAVMLGVLLVSALDGARAEDPAAATATPTPTPTEVIEEPTGSLPALIASGDASDMPEHLRGITLAFAQRLRSAPLEVLSWEQHEWFDGCFDLGYPGGCPPSVSPVPGYRLTLRGAEGDYVLRTDSQGGRYRVEAAPPLPEFLPVFTWRGETETRCLEVRVSQELGGTIAGCGEPPTVFMLSETSVGQSGMLEFLLTYRIDGNYPDGEVMVLGIGNEGTGPSTIRAAFEFGRFLAGNAYTGRYTDAALAVAWGDDNAEACTRMRVQAFGMAYRTCEDPSEPERIYLDEDELRQMYEWLDTYAPFTVDDEVRPRTFSFHGRGPANPDPDARYPDQETALAIHAWFEALAQ